MKRDLASLEGAPFDLLIIGGGIIGAGAARDAALRGLRVALIDKADFASGTSSRSSKLIHGGLRYLEQFDFKLVYEALRERDLLVSKLAPHLVRPVSFLYPLHKKVVERPYVGAGLAFYDAMEGTRRPWPGEMNLQGSRRRRCRPLAPRPVPPKIVTGGPGIGQNRDLRCSSWWGGQAGSLASSR